MMNYTQLLLISAIHMIIFGRINALLALWPHGTVSVCAGDELQFNCIATGRLLEWRIDIMPANGTVEVDSYRRLIDTFGQRPVTLMVNSVIFIFSTSAPLTSMLSISSATGDLNRTDIICMDRATQDSSSAHIRIIDNSELNFLHAQINITTKLEQLERNRTLIILKWTGSLPFLSYSITSSPQVAITLLGQKSAQMVVLYNTYYAVNVVGIPPCGEDNVSSSTLLYYANCDNPATIIDASIIIDDQSYLQIPGDIVTFNCTPGLLLTGPNSSTCMRNGNWEPDPREVKCEGKTIEPKNEITIVVLVSSIVSTFLCTFIFTFIIGCICGVCCIKRCQIPRDHESHSHDMYEEVEKHDSERTEHKQDLELQQNVAYAPINANLNQ